MRSQAQKQEIVLAYLDWVDKQEEKAKRAEAAQRREVRETAFSLLYALSKPGSAGDNYVRDSLVTGRPFPDAYDSQQWVLASNRRR
jgi:hypothetical protein